MGEVFRTNIPLHPDQILSHSTVDLNQSDAFLDQAVPPIETRAWNSKSESSYRELLRLSVNQPQIFPPRIPKKTELKRNRPLIRNDPQKNQPSTDATSPEARQPTLTYIGLSSPRTAVESQRERPARGID